MYAKYLFFYAILSICLIKKKKSENTIVKVIRNIYLPQLLRTSHIC
jgi:hypothetical protein